MVQIIIGAIVSAIIAVILFFLYKKRKNERTDLEEYARNSLEKELATIKIELAELVKDDNMIITNDINYEAIIRNKRRVSIALTDCVYGIDSAVSIVKALIRDILERDLPTMEDINEVVDFSNLMLLEPMVKWEVLVAKLKSRLKNDKVVDYLDTKYNISELREVDEGSGIKRRCFDYKLLDKVFSNEVDSINYSEALNLVGTLLFQKYKGFGCIDTLRALPIDGLNFGTSGSIRYEIDGNYDAPYRMTNSVWVQINAKWVHFSFLDFYKVGEMKRVVNQIMSWGTTAPMNEKRAYKVNDMYDGSRVTAIRPPAGECWACFIRKFTLSVYSMEQLMKREYVHNWELPAKLMQFLMKAEETTAFTGQQNTGKTTMMKSAIEYVDVVNIRVLEMSFELALREIYPGRNIFTVKPTDYVSASNLQDTLKKTDGYLSLVGEVAEDIVAARMIQFCIIASAFTIFSHHGKDDAGLIEGLAQSLVASGEYKDHNVALSTVLDAIQNNVHLNFMDYGNTKLRYIEYISEIYKEDTVVAYPEVVKLLEEAKTAFKSENVNVLAQCMIAYTNLTREYYTRSTDRVRFSSNKIIVFDRETMTYKPNDWYSPRAFARILSKLHDNDKQEFLAFWRENWRDKSVTK